MTRETATPPEQVSLYAFDVDAAGKGRPLEPGEYERPIPDDVSYRWIHLNLNHPDAHGLVERLADETVSNALTSQETRPRAQAHGRGVLLSLRGVNLNPGSDPEDMVGIRMYVMPRMIISSRLRKLMAVVTLRERIQAGTGPDTVAEFIRELAAGLTERMDGVINDLGDQVDDLEDRSLDNEKISGLRTSIIELRRDTIMLRRYIGPQREALGQFSIDGASLMDGDDQISLRESIDRVTRMVEELDAIRERAAVLYDQLSDRRAEEMNRNMMVLSVVAAVFLPLGFITGLLGINVGGLPGTDSPIAFGVVCALCAALGGVLVFFFHRLRWI